MIRRIRRVHQVLLLVPPIRELVPPIRESADINRLLFFAAENMQALTAGARASAAARVLS